MDWQELAFELRQKISGQVLARAPMERFTTWRVGGPADLLVIPRTKEDVQEALLFTRKHDLPITVIGNGSNLLVLDRGIRGLVLKFAGGLNTSHLEGNILTADGGALLPSLARLALKSSLSGLEFGAGIPASLGGAILMNAGAFGQDMGSIALEVETIDQQGKVQQWSRDELFFSYRSSSLQGKNLIVLKADLQLVPAAREEIAVRIKKNIAFRSKIQPLEQPTAGSVFRNPPDDYAGRLIESAGLKGLRIGDAMVSTKHANFIVNCGKATGREIQELIKTIQDRVVQQFGIILVPEVLIVGEEG